MTTPLIGLLALFVIAFISWAIAEGKNKAIDFSHSEEELEGYEEMCEAYEANGNKELNLKDLIRKNCTTGYKSI